MSELILGPTPENKQEVFYIANKDGRTTEELPVEELWAYSGDSMRHKPEDHIDEGEK